MTPEEELAQLQAARAALLSGKQQTEVQYGERRVKYAVADLADLNTRIAELTSTVSGTERRPLGVIW
jgi:hypothetical protein